MWEAEGESSRDILFFPILIVLGNAARSYQKDEI